MNPVPLMKTLVADSLTNRNPRDASASKKSKLQRMEDALGEETGDMGKTGDTEDTWLKIYLN